MVAAILCASVLALPCEYVVDCTDPPPPRNRDFRFAWRFESADGKVIADNTKSVNGASPWQVVSAFTHRAKGGGWRVEVVGPEDDPTGFVLRGSKTAPVKSVEFQGDWVPKVTRRLVVPPPKD